MSGFRERLSRYSALAVKPTSGKKKMGRPCIAIEIGERFGILTVVRQSVANEYKYAMWECVCDCGTIVIRPGHRLRKNKYKSCGCLHREFSSERMKTHGLSQTKTYWVWHNMKHRCADPDHPSWSNYGARGITVCDRWLESVHHFIADMGERPDGYFIDRIDNSKGYSKDNCRWVTRKENSRNKRNNHFLTYNGETLTLAEWQERTGINWNTLRGRIMAGWNTHDTLTIPLQKNGFFDPTKCERVVHSSSI